MSHEQYVKIGKPETKVMEECAEVIMAICKCDRFGWDNHHPDYDASRTNAIVVWEEMDDAIARMKELKKRLVELNLEPYKLVVAPPISECAYMTMKEFVLACSSNALTNDDGYGYYAIKAGDTMMVSDKIIEPSYVVNPKRVAPLDQRFTHVVWINQ